MYTEEIKYLLLLQNRNAKQKSNVESQLNHSQNRK